MNCSAPSDQQTDVHRKMLAAVVSSICVGAGFDSIEKDALASLVEIFQCFFSEVAILSKNYTELSGRSEPLMADILLAFVDMGIDFTCLEEYIKTAKYPTIPPLVVQQPPKQPNMLTAGVKQPLPSHIPSYLPEFPVPHAYIRTPTHRQPIIDYESVREKAALQKKDVERALTKFLAKTSPMTHNLFDSDETNIFPLIASQPPYPPYLSALMPQDQIFDAEDLEYDPKAEAIEHKKQKDKKKEALKLEKIGEENDEDDDKSDENNVSSNFIDNPYLAATKLPASNEGMMEVS